jgi:hypothetical protein
MRDFIKLPSEGPADRAKLAEEKRQKASALARAARLARAKRKPRCT